MIYQDVLGQTPSYWSPMGSERFLSIPLDVDCKEYMDVRARLEGSYFKRVTGIYRVQNPLLWCKFNFKRIEYQARGDAKIKTLFHDTSFCNINSICECNLDWRMGERFMFGPGVYFSVIPNMASKHSSKTNGPFRAMFVVDVLVQNVQNVSDEDIFFPDPGYDTVLAHGEQTYVKYFDSEFYPRYFMTYEAKNGFATRPDSYFNGYFYNM